MGESDAGYFLPRNSLSSCRLAVQHQIFTKRQGFLLHPTIKQSIRREDQANGSGSTPQTLRIADLGCANGRFVFDVHDELVSELKQANSTVQVEITGLDISPAQFPPRSTWPRNINFQPYDFFKPVPEELQGYFDVVHVQIIVAGIHSRDKDVAIRNMLTMLKPGGWIQWGDVGFPTAFTFDASLSSGSDLDAAISALASTPNMMDLKPPACVVTLQTATNMVDATVWVRSLSAHLTRNGFVDSTQHDYPVIRELLGLEHDVMCWTIIDSGEGMRASGRPALIEAADKHCQELKELCDRGELLAYSWTVAIGRKGSAN